MKSILIPTDFSSGAANACRYGIALAKKTGAKAIFMHTSYFSESKGKAGLKYEEALKEATANSLSKLKKETEKIMKEMKVKNTHFKYEWLIDFSPSVADSILKVANEKNVSLIVAGTHGATGLKKILFGSNTAHLIAKANVPVLALPLAYKTQELKEIFYSTDLSNPSAELKKLYTLNKKLKAKVTVVHIDYGWALAANEAIAVGKLEKGKVPFKRIQAKIEKTMGETLNKFMAGNQKAALCMFHEKRSGIGGFLFGNKTKDLAYNLKFPLISFPK